MHPPKKLVPIMNFRQMAIALLSLLAGALVYLADRPPEATWFVQNLPFNLSLHNYAGGFLGGLGKFLPAFVHVFAFSVLTAAVLGETRMIRLNACLFWLAADTAFELGQKFPDQAVKLVPGWFSQVPILDQTSNYFMNGSYHPLDVLAGVAGAGAAYFILSITKQSHPSKQSQPINLHDQQEEGIA